MFDKMSQWNFVYFLDC